MRKKIGLIALIGIGLSFTSSSQKYSDGRPEAKMRMEARDYGIVLRYGDGPDKCDILGARDVWVFEDKETYYMHYDAAGPNGWLSSLAVSKDLVNWEKKGPILDFGQPGEDDSKSAAYGVTYPDGDQWHMFYLGTPNVSPAPNLVPSFPYLTMKAKSNSPSGPWIKQTNVIPFRTKPDTYYSITASPGHVIKNGDEYLQFFSSTTRKPGNPCVQRTLGIARTKDLDGSWIVDPKPSVPIEEQVENSSLYYEKSVKTWFLFTNHIGIEDDKEFTDAVWVYWSQDLNSWDPQNKAVVLDAKNCSWSNKCIGLPSVVEVGKQLALFYDAPGGESINHMKRNVGLAWINLPLSIPTDEHQNSLNSYNVVWQSPSLNSLGSMPAGNGDIGINLWVEENGDLLFYISKTDAWSENARLLKIGKVRLSLSPNPFKSGLPFSQVLVLEDGVIHIEAGELEKKVAIDIWVDANNPLIELDINSQQDIVAHLSTEPWRTHSREITDKNEIHSAYGLQSATVSKDTIIEADKRQVIWAHRNEKSVWSSNMKLQGLEGYMQQSEDPLQNRTFGALIQSDQLQKVSPYQLENKDPAKELSATIVVHTAQTETMNDWIGEIQHIVTMTDSERKDELRIRHEAWWKAFWNRSYIHVSTQVESEKEKVFNVSRGYALQRYMNACSGRGNSPIKFNGSIFTVDTKDLQGKYNGFDADYRQWGGPYWWQNTRLPYWSMLEAGDFDLMLPLFKMYKDALEVRKFATQKYYGHDGAFYPETMRHWGTYVEANYGEDRSELPLGMTQNRYIRYYWQGGLELSLMMLDYYSFTQDQVLLTETILPVVKEIINFFDQHWGRDENGKILFDPAMALETYNTAVNPLPEIVGINKVCSELLNLPSDFFTDAEIQQFSRLIQELPEIPMQELDGEKVLAPAHEYSGKQNIENPELYAIFPYRTYGLGKDDLGLARRTFENRLIKQTGGWQQNAIKAALLGLTEEATKLTSQNFNASSTSYRFPTMWGPNYDWTPDQCHGSVAMTALQRMLVQYEGDEIYLFPAWPEDWDVEFKLRAPKNSSIEATLKNGEITYMKVTPLEREKNVILNMQRRPY